MQNGGAFQKIVEVLKIFKHWRRVGVSKHFDVE